MTWTICTNVFTEPGNLLRLNSPKFLLDLHLDVWRHRDIALNYIWRSAVVVLRTDGVPYRMALLQ